MLPSVLSDNFPRLVVDDDQIPWSFGRPKNILVIGDLHGDFNALRVILETAGVINKKGKWTGNNTHLILMGDLNDRGNQSRQIMDFIVNLESLIPGQVHALLGNHELMVLEGNLEYTSESDLKDFKEFDSYNPGIVEAFRTIKPYSEWLSRRNSILQMGNYLFVHASVGNWILQFSPGHVNSTVRAWVQHWQGRSGPPDFLTRWAVNQKQDNPLWPRPVLSPNELLDTILERVRMKYGAEVIVVGHTITPSGCIEVHTRPCGMQIVQTDTGISSAVMGNLSALRVVDGCMTILDIPGKPSSL
jgi:hypothetical protein